MNNRKDFIKNEDPYSVLYLISLTTLMRGDFIRSIKFLAKKDVDMINKGLFQKFFYELRNGKPLHRLSVKEREVKYSEYYNLLRQLFFSQSNTSRFLQKYSEIIHEEFIDHIIREYEVKADKITIIGGFISFFPLLLSILFFMNTVMFNIIFLLIILIIYNLLLLIITKIVFRRDI